MSVAYGAVAVLSPQTADVLTVAFVALLLVPACAKRFRADRRLQRPR